MIGRWIFVAVVGLGLAAYVHAADSTPAATITQTCAAERPGVVSVQIGWNAPKPKPEEQWLDLSLSPEFLPGWIHAYGPLQPDETSSTIDAAPGVRYYYRVNVRSGEKWRIAASGHFISQCDDAPDSVEIAAATRIAEFVSVSR